MANYRRAGYRDRRRTMHGFLSIRSRFFGPPGRSTPTCRPARHLPRGHAPERARGNGDCRHTGSQGDRRGKPGCSCLSSLAQLAVVVASPAIDDSCAYSVPARASRRPQPAQS